MFVTQINFINDLFIQVNFLFMCPHPLSACMMYSRLGTTIDCPTPRLLTMKSIPRKKLSPNTFPHSKSRFALIFITILKKTPLRLPTLHISDSREVMLTCSQHCGRSSASTRVGPTWRAKATHPVRIICLRMNITSWALYQKETGNQMTHAQMPVRAHTSAHRQVSW